MALWTVRARALWPCCGAARAHELRRAAPIDASAAERVAVAKSVGAVENVREDVDAAVRVHCEALVAHVRQAERAAHGLERATQRVTWREGVLVVRKQEERVGQRRVEAHRYHASATPSGPDWNGQPLIDGQRSASLPVGCNCTLQRQMNSGEAGDCQQLLAPDDVRK